MNHHVHFLGKPSYLPFSQQPFIIFISSLTSLQFMLTFTC